MLERTLLSNLIHNEEYVRKVLPYLKAEYFRNESEKILFETIEFYIHKYNTLPTVEALRIDYPLHKSLNEFYNKECHEIINGFTSENNDLNWLLDTTEKFCQDKAIENALYKSIAVLEQKAGSLERGSIPKLLQDALAVSFDTHIGHDYLGDWEKRYDFYHENEIRVPFDIDILNKITQDGITRKTLNLFMGGVGFGKTLLMCHCAANNLTQGLNVLYITMEMAEERISERIDANLLDVSLYDLKTLPKPLFEKKIQGIRAKTVGKLIIKEYPGTSAGADNFRHLLNELKLKSNFTPDVIYIDYINICKSSRVKLSGSVNTYVYVKFIAEEIRGLAVEMNVPIISATQLNREGFVNSNPGMEHISESFGLAATCDLILSIVSNEELVKLNQMRFGQIKNRYGDLNYYNSFFVGCDRSKMRLFNLDNERDNTSNTAQAEVRKTLFADFK